MPRRKKGEAFAAWEKDLAIGKAKGLIGKYGFTAEDLADIKQELLDESSERVRLERLCELLAIAAEAVERQKEISDRAQSNGKVMPPE